MNFVNYFPMWNVALCGTLWAERGDTCKITVEHLTDLGKKKTTTVGALIYDFCMKY